MEESMIPSISGGAVGSRFVSQTDIESARARRDEQWKAAYARFILSICLPFILVQLYPIDWAKNHHQYLQKTLTMEGV
jgi:hypothetical protein